MFPTYPFCGPMLDGFQYPYSMQHAINLDHIFLMMRQLEASYNGIVAGLPDKVDQLVKEALQGVTFDALYIPATMTIKFESKTEV